MKISLFAVVILVAFPMKAVAYNQGYYEGYYQGYYQSSYYTQTYYQSTYQTTFSRLVEAAKGLTVSGAIAKGSGSFVIDHPLDPANKLLYHSFVESPDAKNIYDGIVVLDALGQAAVRLPDYFEALNSDFRYQVKGLETPMPGLYISQGVKDNRFVIAGGIPHGRVSWQVSGIRHDPYIKANPIRVEVDKKGSGLVEPGQYLHDVARRTLEARIQLMLFVLRGLFGAP